MSRSTMKLSDPVSAGSAIRARDRDCQAVVDVLGPALEQERLKHQAAQSRLDHVTRTVARQGKKIEELEAAHSAQGAYDAPQFDMEGAIKAYAHILYSDVKSDLDEETRLAAEKYLA